jgi:hypothetical protein
MTEPTASPTFTGIARRSPAVSPSVVAAVFHHPKIAVIFGELQKFVHGRKVLVGAVAPVFLVRTCSRISIQSRATIARSDRGTRFGTYTLRKGNASALDAFVGDGPSHLPSVALWSPGGLYR